VTLTAKDHQGPPLGQLRSLHFLEGGCLLIQYFFFQVEAIRPQYHTSTLPPSITSRPKTYRAFRPALNFEAHNMVTSSGSSDVSSGYPVRPRSSSSTHVSTNRSPVETSPLEGYADAPTTRFTGIPDLQKLVRSQSDDLLAGRTTEQFLVFLGVTKDCLAQIDRHHASIGKHTRMTHYTDKDLLIIKLMPSAEHEAAHLTISYVANRKLEGMGLPMLSLFPVGARTLYGFNNSKEGDSTYKPRCRPQKDAWPTFIVEAGLSESLTKLRTDAEWWLTNSRGEAKIVLVISLMPAEKRLLIEQWCMPLPLPTRPRPVIRAHSNANANANANTNTNTNTNTTDAIRIQELTIIQDPPIPPLPGTIPTYTVTGAPLILDFAKLLLRAPVPPEGNVIFTAADLQQWAGIFWSNVI
jgi:hypothetical protein